MQRLNAHYEQELSVAADRVWTLLRDWTNLLKWWPADAPFPILSCEPIGKPSELPFGRKVLLPGNAIGIEYLLAADEPARRLYYRLENGSLPGIVNYLASTMVDELGDGRCRMIFSSMFDVPDGVDPAAARGIILSVYHAIARGMEHSA